MAENTSKVQHITALDFDMDRAMLQLDELLAKFNSIANKIADKTIPISLQDAFEAKDEINRLKEEIDRLNKEIEDYNQRASEAGDSTDNFAKRADALSDIITYKLVNALEEAGRAAYDAVKSTEDSMTEISRVLELTGSEAENMRSQLFGLGQEFGRSFDDVSAAALKFAQSGSNMQESIENTRAMMLALNTAELDVESGTQSLIGIMSQWNMEASDLTTIIDKLNYTADNNAVTTQDLVDGLLKASSMAKTAGISFNDTVGVLTALKESSGAAGKEVGNAFKSILAYIQRPKSLDLFDEMGIEVYADKVTGELLPMMTILENMTNKWNTSQTEMLDTMIKSGDAAQMMSEEWAIATNTMGEYTDYQNAMAEATDKANTAEARAQAQAAAGVYRRNYYISLMENFTKAMEVSKDLVNAEGHSMAENSRYMETLTAKTEQLIAALTELAVTAADAGLLDVAKAAIDTATAFVQWTSESQNLIPVLTSIAGVLITIKAQKIADEFISIGGAFKNAGNAIKTGLTTLSGVQATAQGATTALNGAAGAASGLSAALGGIGLAVSAISIVVTIINSVTAAIKQAREEEIRAGEAAAETFTTLSKLKAEYEALEGVMKRTTEQEERYRTVQDEIVKLLGNRANNLEGLTKGTVEYTESLKSAMKAELEQLEIEQLKAASAAEKELGGGIAFNLEGNSRAQDLTSSGNYLRKMGYAKLESGTRDGYIRTSVDMSGNALEDYAKLIELTEVLNSRASELARTYGNDVADAFIKDNMYVAVEKAYDKISEKAEKYIETNAKLIQTQYILENGMPKTIEEQEKMEEAIVLTIDSTGKLRNQILQYVDTLGTVNQKQIDFLEAFSSASFEQTVTNMAKAGTLTSTIFNEILKSNTEFSKKMQETGVTSEEAVIWLNDLYKGYENVAAGAESAGEQVEDFAKFISSTEKNISSINGYIQTLNEGNGLTAEQVLELCDNYGLLSEQFTLTEKGYQIEVSALEQLREVQEKAAIAARTSQINQTKVLDEGVLDRIAAYGIEIESIANLAEAQAALAELEKERAMASAGISSRSDYEEWNKKYNTDEYKGLVDSIKDIATAYEDTERLADGFYKTLGVSFDTKKKETDVLKEITAAFEHLVDIGVYSIDEQIAYYEDLRRTVALTEEQYKSLESTLSKLYQEQLKQQQEAIKEQYEAKKEALEKTLEDEMDARKEYWSDELDNLKTSLNEQINTAKKVYEQKKKLTEKSHDNQQKSLEALRDSELANIKATYNAQIDALNKIKAARQAERDEEDYQNKRAELLEQISYYEQRTGTDAVEQLESLRKQLAELDRDRQRELEDEGIDNQISSLEEERDSKTEAVKNSYNQRIEALKTAQEIEVDMYKETYDREVELLKKRLDSETKEMEKRRDRDLKRLEEEQSAKLKALEDEKDAAIKAADTKWKEIQKVFNDSNLALIAAAGQFAPALYEQFHNLFTSRFELDLQELASLMEQLETKKSTFAAKSGVKPTTKAADTSLITTIPSFINKKNMAAAATGGKTLSDGIAMLHKDELVVNAPVTKMLEDILTKISPITKLDAMAIQGNIARYWGEKAIQGYRERTTNIRNSYQNSTNNDSSTSVINNFNAPLQHIERVEDGADMEAAVNALERDIMRKVSTML